LPSQNDNQAVLNLLEEFNGLASLKKLQAQLNWDREDAPISRQSWKGDSRQLLLNDPVVTASVGGASQQLFGEEQSFKVIYCRLASPELLLTHERAVVAELLGSYPYALFVFSDKTQKRFHFLNVKDEPEGQKRRLFRRITVGNGERLRTAATQLALLDGEILKRLSLSGIQAKFDEAFDVGPVTKRFFAEYKRVFELVKEGIKGFATGQAGDEARNLFTQRLFNRLMFLAFIQKKGWLQYDGNPDYLRTLWTAHETDKFANKGSFYEGRLKLLFFEGLGANSDAQNLIGINRGGTLKTIIGDVPYLNGGLFEKDADDGNPKIKVPDTGLDQVINGLFEQFNFTITESTPLDIEVAVDPEMLGKIFEELVTGRHESGSYYTPKPIVSFMCREALKGYLETQVPTETKETVARFVDRHEPDDIRDAEAVLNALRRVTVCDPACGSGAYLLGMLHELLDLRECLFKTKNLDHEKVYDRKLEIIQTNVYGVDIAEFAVNIARLRLWLSLAVDFVGGEPAPLPNLDYKIEVGDSLMGPNPSGGLELGLRKGLIDQLLQLKAAYLTSHGNDKASLRDKVEFLKVDIYSFAHRGQSSGFDWAVEFAEIFVEGGFDIVIANPPYGDIGSAEIKREFKKSYPMVADNDLAQAFVIAGERLLSTGGTLGYIVSNSILLNVGASKFRSKALLEHHVLSIVDLSSIRVFENPVVRTVILSLQRGAGFQAYNFAASRCLSFDSSGLNLQTITADVARFVENDNEWAQVFVVPGAASQLVNKMRAPESIPLSRLFTVSQGLIPYDKYRGHSVETIKNRIWHATSKLDKTYRKELKGADVRKYSVQWNGQTWISYGSWLAAPRDPKFFREPRVLVREITDQQTGNLYCAYTSEEFYNTPSLINIVCDSQKKVSLYYLLGLLNSQLFAVYHLANSPKARKGLFPKILVKDVRELPIIASPRYEKDIESRVKALQLPQARSDSSLDRRSLEQQIEMLVLKIYGVKAHEVVAAAQSLAAVKYQSETQVDGE
jgi:type I restriction-modification system DNA methylase subunit